MNSITTISDFKKAFGDEADQILHDVEDYRANRMIFKTVADNQPAGGIKNAAYEKALNMSNASAASIALRMEQLITRLTVNQVEAQQEAKD